MFVPYTLHTDVFVVVNATLNPTPYTLHPTPYTLNTDFFGVVNANANPNLNPKP